MVSSTHADVVQKVDDTHSLTEYERLLCRLYTTNLFNAKSNGLEQMNLLHDAVGCPMDNLKVVHIAGSNGKGSTAVKIANTLHLSKYKVGLFTSPHISSFRERIQINGVPVSEEQVVTNLREVFGIIDEKGITSTFFEIVTVLALKIFIIEEVEVVVLETGLGGRLDATNIVKHPLLSVITSIGLEHTHILGDTIEKIALEKGGIIKEDCPVLVGNNLPKLVMKQCAEERKASAFYECDDILGDGESNDKALDYDAENSRIATAALTLLSAVLTDKRILQHTISQGVKARPPCRFEEISVSTNNARQVTAILDVAHNPQALEQLFSKIQSKYPGASARIVVGMSADKDIRKCSDITLDFVSDPSKVHLVESSNPRAASIATILECNPLLKDSHHQSSTESMNETESSVAVQVKKAIDLASANNELLVVCGTFFIMSEARSCLGINEPRDREVVSNVTGDKK
jgi:dihydrofolate synthase/folylpolyglutamate synthase